MHARLPLLAALSAALPLIACSSPQERKGTLDPFIPDGKNTDAIAAWNVEDQSVGMGSTVGFTIASLDKQLTAWNNYKLNAEDQMDMAAMRRIESKIAADTTKKFSIVEEQLTSGSIYNRQVAAMALGFTGSRRALPPLLVALGDSEPEVVANAALGLSRLGFADTDLEPLMALLEEDQPMKVRVNASLAINKVVHAGGRHEGVEAVLRRGLLDEEPGVRVHCAIGLAYLGASDAVPDLTLLLRDGTPHVVRATAASMVTIGDRDPHAFGQVARGLASALQSTDEHKELLRDSLRSLSRRNYGDDDEQWLKWAMAYTPEN